MENKKAAIRARFRWYRRQIEQLIQEIDNLNLAYEDATYRERRANKRAEAYYQECEERQRQAELDNCYRQEQVKKATRELERARAYGDDWSEERALRKLKRIIENS